MIDNKFPTIGEVYNFFIDALGVLDFVKPEKKNSITKDIERLIKEKSIDVENFIVIENEIINVVMNLLPNNQILELFPNLLKKMIYSYLEKTNEFFFAKNEDMYKFMFISFGYTFILIANIDKYTFINQNEYFPKGNWFLPQFENDKVIYPIKNVIKWWMELNKIETFKEFAEKVNGKEIETQNNGFQTNMQRWFSNESIIKIDSINKICETDFNIKNEEINKQYLKFNLVISKMIGFFFKKIEVLTNNKQIFVNILNIYNKINELLDYNCKEIIRVLNNNKDYEKYDTKIKHRLINNELGNNNIVLNKLPYYYGQMNINSNNVFRFEIIKKKFEDLYSLNNLFSLTKEKNIGDFESAKRKIESFEENKEQTSTYYSFLCWIKARFYVLQNNSEESIKWYKEAYENGKYCIGKFFIEILKEYIVLACELKDVKTVKNLYKIAYYFGLYEEKYEEVKEYFMAFTSRKFEATFNNAFYYKEIIETQDIKRNISSLIIETEYFEHFENLYKNATEKNVNKFIDDISVKDKKTTLLVIYSHLKDSEKVKKLLTLGADVNICSSDNGHALINSIQINDNGLVYKEKESEEIVMMLLNDVNLKKETINTITKRKKISAIHDAVEFGNIEILKKIIEKCGNINLKATLDDITPLYFLLSLLTFIKKGFPTGFKPNIKSLRYADINYYISNDLFDHEFFNSHLLQNEEFKKYEEIYKKHYIEILTKKYKNYLEIFDYLLENNADINNKQMGGFTPFLYSSELGELKIFKKLLEKGGNIYEVNDSNSNILTQSLWFDNLEIVEYILSYLFSIKDEKDISKIINIQIDNNKLTPLNLLYLTPLHILYLKHRNSPLFSSLFDKLLLLNPDLTLKDSFGKTVFEYAFENKDNFVINKFTKKQ